MPYRFRPPVAVEIVGVPAPDADARLKAAIKLVADAIARQAWDEAVAEVEAELRAEEEARRAAAGGAA